ncbi:hypothetical protein AN639_06310 [Candidatus Epulonipiscium fishelsonii]|uniref:Uncharacterized protein n=1 Tax=Candidatus Epulonipiscium fishelsonii TaxID=77094 RepID=A0ACC8XAM6_9FIRM|nr:hypothetical protein AN639_06310 [Epulopiscium sp. SCG-B05WGA-EpuloA1]ONI39476.1 hypothetical protein AN396_08725 [Epulopiscium sp. SCG-B11WGA-EpuloA1]
MSLETCRLCGDIFDFKYEYNNDSLLCQNCLMDEEKIIEYVQNFLDSNNSNMLRAQIYKKIGVSTRHLQQLLDEEKIKLDNIDIETFCISCGEITNNQICDKCKITFKYEASKLSKILPNGL